MDFLKFQENYSVTDFPLTISMIEKNDYSDANVIYNTDNDGLTSLCIYTDVGNFIKIEVLEVRNDCKHQHYGSNLINKIKAMKKPIYLNSMPNAMDFYKKLGFKNDKRYKTYMNYHR